MRILRADAMGFCFGVRDALATALAQPRPAEVTIHGELVHNATVRQQLAERGFGERGEAERDPAGPPSPRTLITAHGISDAERAQLRATGTVLVDTTCPLVRRAHGAARRLAADGCFVIVLGKARHVEVRGLVGDLPGDGYAVLGSVAEVVRFAARRLGVVCQTTFRLPLAQEIVAEIERQNPHAEVRFVDTVCEPTKQRIAAAEQLAAAADVVVVVGGANSNNTRQLVEVCAAAGAVAHHVQGPEDLEPAWLAGAATVGLTAGTSTLGATIDAVEERLRALGAA